MIIGPANGIVLRDYQNFCIDGGDPRKGPGIMPCFARYKKVLAVMATGLGKTATFLMLARRYIESPKVDPSKRVLILAHRDELVTQPIKRGRSMGLQLAREQGDDTAVGKPERVIASTIQTMCKRFAQYQPNEIGLIIADECFPAGTLIDGRPIEQIQVGDLVRSFNHDTNRVEMQPVARLYRKPAWQLVRLHLSDGTSIACTASHPFAVSRSGFIEYVPAMYLYGHTLFYGYAQGSGDAVHRLHDTGHTERGQGAIAGPPGPRLLLEHLQGQVGFSGQLISDGRDKSQVRLRTYEGTQSHAQGGAPANNVGHAAESGVEAEGSGWERQGDHAAEDARGRPRLAHGGRRDHGGKEARPGRSSTLLQDRRGERGEKNRSGGGWTLACDADGAGPRPAENCISPGPRVDRVEVLEFGSLERLERVCPGGVVYNIEVERNHNYFANDILVHNCHHAASDAFRSVFEHFPSAYILGVTATPHRLDGIGMGEVFEAVAFNYPIEDGVADGWLVPVKAWPIKIEGLDIEKLRARSGDLEPGPLGELLAEYAHPVAKDLVERAGSRRTLVFCATVAHAFAQAEAIRRYTDARVECLYGGTPKKKSRQRDLLDAPPIREDVLADFEAGRIQFVTNCGVLAEGVDLPSTSCVAMVRPTKSQAVLVQAVGRGTRPLPGVVDRPELADDPEARRAAIAASAKPDLLVLDFTTNTEKHSLCGVVDALAGNLSTAERLALAKVELYGDKTVDQAVAEARILAAEDAARQAAELAEQMSTSYEVDPFHPVCAMGIKGLRDDPNEKRASEKMAKYLKRHGIEKAESLSASTAKKLQGTIIVREKLHLSTISQSIALQRAGVPVASTVKMSVYVASQLMAELHQSRGVRPKRWDSDPLLGGRKA